MKHILLLTMAAAGLSAADATGTWTGTLAVLAADGGQNPGPAHMVLRQEGAKLTGTAGPGAGEQFGIMNGKAEDGKLSFELPVGGMTMKFALKQEGDEIQGDVTRESDGRTERAKLAVKRAK